MINNIKNNTISEADAKQKLNALDKIKKVKTKNKRLINGQKILLSLFDDSVEAISNNDNNKSENKNDNESVNDTESINDNESVNDNDVNDGNDDHDEE